MAPADFLDALQWPAMALTVAASWMVASKSPWQRRSGFWIFLLSNLVWAVWGWHTGSWALLVLQGCLAVMNVRGAAKNDEAAAGSGDAGGGASGKR